MPTFALRITKPYAELNLIIEYLDARSTELVVAEHSPATRTAKAVIHCHFYINSSVGYDAIRDKLKSLYSGNAGYSLKTKYGKDSLKQDVDTGAIKYMLKGTLEPCYSKGVSNSEINNLRSQWVEPVSKLVYASPSDASGIQQTYVELPIRVLDPMLRTQKGMLEVIRNRLNNLTYDCKCVFCKAERRGGQSVLPIQWSLDNIHENKRRLIHLIHTVMYEANKVPDDKTVQKFVYSVYYTQFVSEDGWRTPDFIFERLHL